MRRLLRRLIFLPVALAFAGCATNPVTGKRELTLVSEGQESPWAGGGEGRHRGDGGVSGPCAAGYVSGIGMAMAKASERPGLPWSFTVIDDAAVNAFALPGGPVFITRGILGYVNSEGQMASVLGHEIGHITARHSVRQISARSSHRLG